MSKGINGCFFCGGEASESLVVECGNNAELSATVDMCGPCFNAFIDDEDGFRGRNSSVRPMRRRLNTWLSHSTLSIAGQPKENHDKSKGLTQLKKEPSHNG